jgi:HPt (histidine-containing phosphotransfer) domain-containing protein
VTLDPAAMARLLEITGDDPAFVDELVDTFLEDATTQLDALAAAAATGDAEGAVRPAHSLKSSSLNVGATTLAELSRAIEADARSGPVDDLGPRVKELGAELTAVRSALLADRAERATATD